MAGLIMLSSKVMADPLKSALTTSSRRWRRAARPLLASRCEQRPSGLANSPTKSGGTHEPQRVSPNGLAPISRNRAFIKKR